jgi:hypothetical protein
MGMVFYLTRLRCLARDRDGSAALEFAYAFPIIVMVVVGLLELMMIMFVSALMEGGLRDASRFAITGAMPAGMSREQAIVNIVNDRTLGLLDLTTDDVSLRVYEAFAQVGMPEPLTFDANGNGSFDPGDTYTDVNGNGQWDADMAAAGAGVVGASGGAQGDAGEEQGAGETKRRHTGRRHANKPHAGRPRSSGLRMTLIAASYRVVNDR